MTQIESKTLLNSLLNFRVHQIQVNQHLLSLAQNYIIIITSIGYFSIYYGLVWIGLFLSLYKTTYANK